MKGEEIRPLVEIDFLGLDQKPQHHQPPPPVRSNFVKSIKGIQEAVSLDLLRYVISGHNDPQTSLQLSQTPIRYVCLYVCLFVYISLFINCPFTSSSLFLSFYTELLRLDFSTTDRTLSFSLLPTRLRMWWRWRKKKSSNNKEDF